MQSHGKINLIKMYIMSFLGDWKIVFQTVKTVLKREGISSGESATMEEFTGSADKKIKKEVSTTESQE